MPNIFYHFLQHVQFIINKTASMTIGNLYQGSDAVTTAEWLLVVIEDMPIQCGSPLIATELYLHLYP